ncbi:MAG TPA: beta-ketoacyl synthase N-terminal-like domain-containing protein [Jatrophihabitans sp.]|nr:beta-ketoacyl synthase N-terminal-like domain-containing protein [Jatrophihabitans sp.]
MSDLVLEIADWSVISPFGAGKAEFVDGLRSGRSTVVKLDDGDDRPAGQLACLVPDFDPRVALGRKGTRMMNRVTGLAVSTVGDLIGGFELDPVSRESVGLVLGTSVGSAQSTIDLTRESLTGEKPFHVEPGLIPYAVMNGSAGQCAIWHGLKGPNVTLAAGRPVGLLALAYARRLLLTGRAQTVLCGAAEEFSQARAWLARHSSGEPGTDQPLGEGCVMFAVRLGQAGQQAQPQQTQPRPTAVLGIRTAICSDGDWAGAVRRCVTGLLEEQRLAPGDLTTVCPSDALGLPGVGERTALAELFDPAVVTMPVTELIGETHAASAAFQLAALLATPAGPADDGRPGLSLATSVDDSGTVAAVLITADRTSDKEAAAR